MKDPEKREGIIVISTEQTKNRDKGKFPVADLVYMAVGAVLIIVCTWISIPFTVPFTLQTFAVAFNLIFLGGKRGTVSILVYIILGAVGVPVFSGFMGGIGKLMGMTGGYIIGFIFMGLIYWLGEVLFGKKLLTQILSLLIGLLILYAFGTGWFMIVYARENEVIGLWSALTMCVIPFIIPDLVKLGLAVLVGNKMKKLLHVRR